MFSQRQFDFGDNSNQENDSENTTTQFINTQDIISMILIVLSTFLSLFLANVVLPTIFPQLSPEVPSTILPEEEENML